MSANVRFDFDYLTADMIMRRGAPTYRTPPRTFDPARAAAAYRATARAVAIHGDAR